MDWGETERRRWGLERRFRYVHRARFEHLANFDWQWPSGCDKAAVSDMMSLEFIANATTNLNLVGNNALGKTTIAQNIAYAAVRKSDTLQLL